MRDIKWLDLPPCFVLLLFHQVSDKRLAKAGRMETTLSPQGGGRVQSPPRTPEAERRRGARGSKDRTTPKGSAREGRPPKPGATEAKSAERRTRGREPDKEEKEPKGTGTKG
ncbi:MAG: hypothetical protein RBS55_06940 [Bacteroidales bacterium]|nr:hypothetical protein [Bacteroidales bacterium]